nr:hypothetical protein [Corynebacterium lactis]
MNEQTPHTPPFWPTEGEGDFFADPAAAVDRLTEIHQAGMEYLVRQYSRLAAGAGSGAEPGFSGSVRAYYPELRFTVAPGAAVEDVDPSLSHGFVDRPGVYATTITRPVMYRSYLIEQISDLLANHGGEVEVRVSEQPIPLRMCRGFDALRRKQRRGRGRRQANWRQWRKRLPRSTPPASTTPSPTARPTTCTCPSNR